MSHLFLFPAAIRREPAVEHWLESHRGALGAIAREWFTVMRDCGDDVNELLHDGHPTACVGEAAFAYVDAFKAHVNVGFYRGAELADPGRLLVGDGKLLRHVKLKPESSVNPAVLTELIGAAYADMKRRVEFEKFGWTACRRPQY